MAVTSRGAWTLVVGLLLVLGVAAPALAGYEIVDDQENRTLISKGRIKVVPKHARTVFALDVGAGRLWLANPEARLVWEGTVDEYCAGMRAALRPVVAERERQAAESAKVLERQMEKMTPAQREQVKLLMQRLGAAGAKPGATPGATAPAPVRREVLVQSTPQVDTVAGMLARKYDVFAAGKLYEEIWLTPDLNVGSELNVERAADTFGRMGGCVAGAGKGSDDIVEASPEYSRLYRLGWPLKMVIHEDDQGKGIAPQTRMLVTTMARSDIPESEFAQPVDYRRTGLDEVLGARSAR